LVSWMKGIVIVKVGWFSCSPESSGAEIDSTEGNKRFSSWSQSQRDLRCFFLVALCYILTNRFGFFYSFWTAPDTSNHIMSQRRRQDQELQLVSEDCNTKRVGLQVQLIRMISPSICTLLLDSTLHFDCRSMGQTRI
jgi:hypothetical protein